MPFGSGIVSGRTIGRRQLDDQSAINQRFKRIVNGGEAEVRDRLPDGLEDLLGGRVVGGLEEEGENLFTLAGRSAAGRFEGRPHPVEFVEIHCHQRSPGEPGSGVDGR